MQPSSNSKKESGDKNCLFFIIKLLNNHFPENKWDSTHQSLKFEKKNQKINWKQIFTAVSSKALHEGVNSLEWQTILKLLEIAPNVEKYLTLNQSDIIKFKGNKSKEIFIDKCKTQITPSINSLMVRVIKESGFGKKLQGDFFDSMETVNWDNFNGVKKDGIYGTGEEVDQNESQYHQEPIPMKKINQTNDFTYNSYNSKEFYSLDEEKQYSVDDNYENSKLLSNIQIEVEERKNEHEEWISENFNKNSFNENKNEELCNDNINFICNQDDFNTQINKQKKLIMYLYEQIHTKDEQIYQKNNQIYQKDDQLYQKDEEIRQKDEEIFQKYEQNNQKDEEIYQKDEEICQKDTLLAEKDKIISELMKSIRQNEKDKNLYEKLLDLHIEN